MGDAQQPDPPRTSRGRATAERLRAAAREVFADVSYTHSRVEDITAAAGVSHGTFYTYYTNRAAVLDALVDEATTRLHDVLERPWQGEDLVQTVRAVIADFVTAMAKEADVMAAWADAAATDPHFRERWSNLEGGFVTRVAAQVAPVMEGTDHDPAVAAAALVAMVKGYVTDRLDAAADGAFDTAIDTLTTIWVGGLRELLRD